MNSKQFSEEYKSSEFHGKIKHLFQKKTKCRKPNKQSNVAKVLKNGKGSPEKNVRNDANTLKFHLDSLTAQQVENRLRHSLGSVSQQSFVRAQKIVLMSIQNKMALSSTLYLPTSFKFS